MPMAQQLADLAERSTMAQHLGGQSMTELVCACGRRIDAGALEPMANERANAAGATNKNSVGGYAIMA